MLPGNRSALHSGAASLRPYTTCRGLHRFDSRVSCDLVDSLTHTLLGASLGYLCLGRRIGRTAAAVGGLAAFSPDADVFIRSASDPLVAIEYHRGFTHALAFVPVGAAVVAALWLVHPAWRNRRWLTLWLAAGIGYLSHPLLDAATTYGTQLWWPFSRYRSGWDMVSVIDPLVTIILLIGLMWTLFSRGKRPALFGVAGAMAYLAFGLVQHSRGVSALEQLAAARGHRIERIEVMPTMANNVIWRGLYLHDGRIFSDRIRVGWFSPPRVREGWSVPLVRSTDLTPEERGRNTRRSFERLAWFADQWIGRSPADATVLSDMRYSLSAEAFDPIWGIRFTPPGAATEVEWVNRSRNRRIALGELWAEIMGRDARFAPVVVGAALRRDRSFDASLGSRR